jgi:hypothetical protein
MGFEGVLKHTAPRPVKAGRRQPSVDRCSGRRGKDFTLGGYFVDLRAVRAEPSGNSVLQLVHQSTLERSDDVPWLHLGHTYVHRVIPA